MRKATTRSRHEKRAQTDRQAVRPERFAWTDEEARLVFGVAAPSVKPRAEPPAGVQHAERGRILVAGHYDPSVNDVRLALERARDAVADRFVIIERSAQCYMQCLCQHAGWLLEKREGDETAHFHALVRQPAAGAEQMDLMSRIFGEPEATTIYLAFEQVQEAMTCYHESIPEPDWLGWRRVDVS